MLLSSLLTGANLVLAIKSLFAVLVIRAIGWAIYNRYFHPYKDFPGPFWASITDLWYFQAVRWGKAERYQLPIHKKYGNFVRISPNQIQIMDPKAIDTIYGTKQVFNKAEFYEGFNPHISKRRGNFEETDERLHSIRRRIVAPLYTQASILEFEPCVDRLISIFYNQIDSFAANGTVFDMAVWLRKYTFDVVGEIFYGREGGFGFMRDNIDYNNWCHLMDVMPPTASAITYLPYGFRTLYFLSEMLNPVTRAGAKGFFDVIKQSHKAVRQRLDDMEGNNNTTSTEKNTDIGDYKSTSTPTPPSKQPQRIDMLTKLLGLVKHAPTDPKTHFTLLDVTTEIWTMIWAGSDTTAIALTAIFYMLHRHPRVLSKLHAEIDDAFATNILTYPVRYNDAVKLPYLHAVVKEAMRMHPSLGTGLPRIVPPEGAWICGRWFAGGYGVIMNQCAVHFDTATFGEDADVFRPERWLEEKDQGYMERHWLQFGYGNRICIGKWITWTEMFKLLPTVLRDFEFVGVGGEEEVVGKKVRFDDGGDGGEKGVREGGLKEWRVWQGWFRQQRGVDVRARRRVGREVREEGVVVPLGEWGRKRDVVAK